MLNLVCRMGVIIACIFLFACSARQDPQIPSPFEVPNNWQENPLSKQIISGWLNEFDEPLLNQYIDQALENNFDLEINLERLNAAIANAKSVNARLYPELDFGLERSRRKSFNIDEQGVARAQYNSNYQTDLTLNWEADIWGKLNDASRNAYLAAGVQENLFRSARLSLAGSVAQTWFNLITATSQLSLSRQQFKSLEEALDIIENSYQSGLVNAADIFTAKSDLENQNAIVAQSSQRLEELKRSFNVLLGQYPTKQLDIKQAHIKPLSKQIPTGLPSELLTRRPDIVAAQLNWLSQDYNRKVAKKNRYPSFKLTGSLGYSSDSLSNLLDSDALLWSLVTGITQPLFNSGRLKALEDSASAQTRQALAEYANTLLTAFTEVENALAAERYFLIQYQSVKRASELAKSAYDLSLEQYQSGLVEYVTVLTNQRLYFSADSNQISLNNDLIQNRINLHLALGGDFFTLDQP